MAWQELLTVIGVPIGRAMAGWAQNAFADGKVDWPEWRKLAETVLKLGVPAFLLYWGLDLDAEYAATLPVLIDYVINFVAKAYLRARDAKKKK